MTANNQKTSASTSIDMNAPLFVQIRAYGDFMNHRKVFIRFPADFTFGSSSSKPYQDAWNKFKELPNGHPYADLFKILKEIGDIRFREMMISYYEGRSYVILVGITNISQNRIISELKDVFGEGRCSFDTGFGNLQ